MEIILLRKGEWYVIVYLCTFMNIFSEKTLSKDSTLIWEYCSSKLRLFQKVFHEWVVGWKRTYGKYICVTLNIKFKVKLLICSITDTVWDWVFQDFLINNRVLRWLEFSYKRKERFADLYCANQNQWKHRTLCKYIFEFPFPI